MSRQLPGTCRWCDRQFAGNRKYCCKECRLAAQENQVADPTPDEIREMCIRIREEGGEAWERSHTCYPLQPVHTRVVAAARYSLAAVEY